MSKKIGIFSGTFDPVHDGHVWLVQKALDILQLDQVIVMVEKSPRRKTNVTDYELRLDMVKIAYSKVDRVSCEGLKDLKNSSNHSVKQTLDAVQNQFSDDIELWLLMGGDVFEYVPVWQDYQSLIKNDVGFFVALRSEDDGEIAMGLLEDKMQGAKVKLVSSELSGVSSTKIRQAISSGEEPKGLNEQVYERIKQQRLYS